MTRSELVKLILSKNPDLGAKVIAKIVDLIFEELSSALEQQNRVEIRRFGTLSVKKRSPRTARNLTTNELIEVSERIAPYFRMGKELRDRINAK